MKLLQFIPIKLNFLLIAGILIGYHLVVPLPLLLVITGLSLVLTGTVFAIPGYRHGLSFGILAAITTVCIGLLSVAASNPNLPDNHYTKFNLNTAGTWHLKVREVLKSTYNSRYIVNVRGVDKKAACGKILLGISNKEASETLEVDDEILLWGTAKILEPPLNPHQFDYGQYMSGIGVQHQIKIENSNFFRLPSSSVTITGLAASVRNSISHKLKISGIAGNELGIIQALLLGERNEISAELYSKYSKAGATHMLAVSGLHIGIIYLILDFLLRPLELLNRGKTIKMGIILLLLWSFALLAGFSASVVRAVTMFSFVCYAFYLNRPANTFNILALSMFFILLAFNPLMLFRAGFQMSYLAVIFIVWIYPMLQKFWCPGNLLVRKLWQLLSISLAAQLGVLPVGLYYFHQFPGLFFVSNLIIIPFLGILLGLGIAVILLALCNALPAELALGYSSLIHMMNLSISWVADQEAFLVEDISFDGVQLLLSYLAICSLIRLLTKINFRKIAMFTLAILALQLWSLYLLYVDINGNQTIIMHQTGNSIILQHSGRTLVIFSADSGKAGSLIRNYTLGERISKTANLPIKNSYKIAEKQLLVIDSLGIIPANHNPDFVLLTQSPGLNLERFLNRNTPQLVIADGSNYSSFIRRWKASCKQHNVPFHFTGEKGAYYFNSGN